MRGYLLERMGEDAKRMLVYVRVIEAVEGEMGAPLSGRGKTRKSLFPFLR
jgi:hypothetical protein